MSKINAEDIKMIHRMVLGDDRILNDAIDSAFASLDYYDSEDEKDASVVRAVVKNHYFVDGNKRTAMAIYRTFMLDRKRPAKYKDEQLGKIFEEIAVNNYSVEEIKEILF